MMKLTTEELRIEYAKQKEKEGLREIEDEYIRVKKLLAESGRLTFDEVSNIALLICRANGTFDRDPVRGRGVGI